MGAAYRAVGVDDRLDFDRSLLLGAQRRGGVIGLLLVDRFGIDQPRRPGHVGAATESAAGAWSYAGPGTRADACPLPCSSAAAFARTLRRDRERRRRRQESG